MYDVITIGTATRDVFLQSSAFKPVKDPHFTPAEGFPSGEAECFALGKKIEIEKAGQQQGEAEKTEGEINDI